MSITNSKLIAKVIGVTLPSQLTLTLAVLLTQCLCTLHCIEWIISMIKKRTRQAKQVHNLHIQKRIISCMYYLIALIIEHGLLFWLCHGWAVPLGRHKNKNTQNYFQHFIRTTSCIYTARMIWSLVYKSYSLAPWLLTNKASLMHKQMHCNNLREEASCLKVTWTHTEVSINCYFLSDALSTTS